MSAHTDSPERATAGANPVQVVLTGEALVYICIGVIAFVLRVVQLGGVPLSDAESYHALAALRTLDPTVPGPALQPTSPVIFAGQLLSLGVLGASEFAARLPVALAGVALVLAPALWRKQIDRLNALGFSALLALSPTAVAAARNTDGVTVTALLAMAAVWLAWRYMDAGADDRLPWAVALAVTMAAMLFLAEPGGPLMALCLAGGLALVWWTSAVDVPATADGSPPPYGATVRDDTIVKALRAFPWKAALVSAAVCVVVISTVLMFYPAGLGAAGEVVGGFVDGALSRTADQPFAWPVGVLLFYEPLVWIFGLVGVFGIRSGDRMGIFLGGWALTGLLLGLLYPSGMPAHALMMVLPLAGLASRAVMSPIFEDTEDDETGEAIEEEDAAAENLMGWDGLGIKAPGWALWSFIAALVGLCAAAYTNLIVFSQKLIEHYQQVLALRDESLDEAGKESIQIILSGIESELLPRGLFVGLVGVMMIILFFIVGATWSNRSAKRGVLIAVCIVLGVCALSGAAGLALYRADDARELWYLSRPDEQIDMLVETVAEGAIREAGTPVTATVAAQIPDDGALAWALRDFEALEFIKQPSAEITAPVVVLPSTEQEPVLGADYLGQDFVTQRDWSLSWMDAAGMPAWMLQRRTLTAPQPVQQYVVWYRTDIYGLLDDGIAPPGE
jgi:hypothetical protein